MYAKPTCPTPLKILLVVVIVVELAAIGLLLAGRAGASEGRDSAVEASASTTPAPTDTPAAPAASDGGETAGGDKASSEPVTLTVTFAGDCTLGTDINYENERSFNSRWQAEEGDATYFLRNVADLFGSDDLTVVNMEGALTEGGERADKKFAFRGKPEYAKILSSASVEAATLANNHSQDYGQTGYDDTIAALAKQGGLYIEVGGGIRTEERIEKYLSLGVNRCILGSVAVTDFDFTARMLKRYGERIAVGVDAKDGFVAIHGWKEVSAEKGVDFCRRLRDAGVKTVIYTDISRDGAEQGTNLDLYRELAGIEGLDITASGGVSSIEELRELQTIGTKAAILGKALYTGWLDLKTVMEEVGTC